MPDASSLLRQLPRVDDVIAHMRSAASCEEAPQPVMLEAARKAVEEVRAQIVAGGKDMDVGLDAVASRAAAMLRRMAASSLGRVVNATGVVLHTGLGRAPLSEAAQEAVRAAAAGYCNVQTDLDSGARTPREVHVEWLIRHITGTESALVVNNNAAATVLVLNALAAGREVIVSRGEMVEIGGSFRIPDIMGLAGCRLVEVGCTNRTHLRDYERAITPETAMILSVHQSNYRIEGFASQADVAELAPLAHARGLVCVHDLGSGALVDLRRFGLPHEPSAPESLAAGADAVLFSGDKLVGGPQCGIILGKAEPLERMRKNPYYRAFRVGKLTLAALEATLRLFLEPDSLPSAHRVTAMLTSSVDALAERATALAERIRAVCGPSISAETLEGESQIGGGSLAGNALPTVVVRVRSSAMPAGELVVQLRRCDPSVFARVHEEAVVLDPRTLLPGDEELIVSALQCISRSTSGQGPCPQNDT